MARARNIKPSLFKNEVLGEADPLLTILFQGLWCLADRDGKLEDRPKRIKAEIFPYRELPNFNGYLTELEQLGFIERYEVENIAVIRVVNFSKHQSPHKTEKASELPCKPLKTTVTEFAPLNNESLTDEAALIPDSFNLIPDSLTKDFCPERSSEPSVPEPVIKIPLVDKTDFGISQTQIDEWSNAYPAIDVTQRLQAIKQWSVANPKRQKTRKGILRHITSWLDKDQNSARSKPNSNSGEIVCI